MKRTGAGIAVIVVAVTLVASPAAAQTRHVWWTPSSPAPVESAGEVVLTVSLGRAGRVAYQTFDGFCVVTYPGGSPEADCSGEKARAPEDYTATSGELVFTGGESKTITVPIVDDDLTDGDERFTLAAWELIDTDGWIAPATGQRPGDRGDSVIVHIVDDDGSDVTRERPGAAGRTPSTAAGHPSTMMVADDRATKASPSRDVEPALAAEDLRRGPGFELTSEASQQPASEDADGADRSASALVLGLGVAAVSVGTLALTRRRRRWSPTRPR